jgi:hypothetical protein
MSPEQKNAPESKMFYKLYFDLKMLSLQPSGLGADELYMIQTLIGTPAGAFLLKKDVFHAGRRWHHELALHQQKFQEQKQQKAGDTTVHSETTLTLAGVQVLAELQQETTHVMSPETLLLAGIEVAEDELKNKLQADVIAEEQRELLGKLQDEVITTSPAESLDKLQDELVHNMLDEIQHKQQDQEQLNDIITVQLPPEYVDEIQDKVQDEVQQELIDEIHNIGMPLADKRYLPTHLLFTANDDNLCVQEGKELPSVKTHGLITRKDYAGCFETLLRTFNLLISTQNNKKQQEDHYNTLHLNLSTLVVYIETLMLDPMHLTDKENHIWHHIALDNKMQSKQEQLTAQDDINKRDWRLQLQLLMDKIQVCKNKAYERSHTSARRNRPSSGLSWRQGT